MPEAEKFIQRDHDREQKRNRSRVTNWLVEEQRAELEKKNKQHELSEYALQFISFSSVLCCGQLEDIMCHIYL